MRILLKILKWIGLSLLGLFIAALVVYAFLPKGPRDLMEYTDHTKQPRELFVADKYAAVAGTPWSTEAALGVLERGES